MPVVSKSEQPGLPDELYDVDESRDGSPHVEGSRVEEEEDSVGDVEHMREVEHLEEGLS